MAEINVPIKLLILNLQLLINDLLNKLSNLKVGSTGFKNIQNLITSMKNELDKLQILSSKPFMDASLFTRAENSVDKLEDLLTKVEITLSRLKFSDLELTPLQKSDLKGFEDLLNSIKANLKTVKDTAKTDFLGSALGKIWTDNFDATAITKTFSLITANIRSEVLNLTKLVDQAKKTWNDYLNAIKANSSIESFLKVKNPLEETNLGAEKYTQIFLETKNGLRFQRGGSTILEEWLKSLLELDDATIKSLVEGSAQKVKSELENRLKAIKLANKDVIDTNTGAKIDYDTLNAKLILLNLIMQQLGASELMVNTVELALRGQLVDTSNAMLEYKDNITNVARSGQEFLSTGNLMRQLLESLRSTLQLTNALFILMLRTQTSFNLMKMAVVNFMGFNQVLNLTKNAIKNAINHIRELDTVMNGISIVTDMSTSDLWDLVDAYSKMAQTYGVSIKGAYEVSQIYYQQGLETADVLTLTNETLKLAKISGLDYATTTDYMTTALRGFKIEMSEASRVVDVYSNLAAHTAVSLEELAVAMSKTASSMEAVGATFEEASAMIGTMVAVTRESATNIGSAMKSIASRYGELTKDPTKLVDEEGEAMAFNKVDAALQSVGISMRTVDGQFREFTDVIVELGEKWNQLDSVQLRYIATQFAGNRQQSRFLALVSNVDLLKSNLDVAMNSEDTGTLQALKALDSIEAKTELVRVAYQQFYTTLGAENVWKGLLDGTKNVINTLNSLPKLFGKIPIGAIAAISSIISLIKGLGIDLLNAFALTFGLSILLGMLLALGTATEGAQSLIGIILSTIKGKKGEFTAAGQEAALAYTQGLLNSNTKNITPNLLTGKNKIEYNKNLNIIDEYKSNSKDILGVFSYKILAQSMYEARLISKETWDLIALHPNEAKQILDLFIASLEKNNLKLLEVGNTAELSGSKLKKFIANHKNLGQGLLSVGSALNMVAMTINTTTLSGKMWSGVLLGMASAATLASAAVKVLNSNFKTIPWMALASGVIMAINAISTLITTPEEKLAELESRAEELDNKAKEAKANYRTLDNSIKKLDELKEKRYESAEATEQYLEAVDELAAKFPQMIAGFDEAGNVILDTTSAEELLAAARRKTAKATYEATQKELEEVEEKRNTSQNNINTLIENLLRAFDTFGTDLINGIDNSSNIFNEYVKNKKFKVVDFNNLNAPATEKNLMDFMNAGDESIDINSNNFLDYLWAAARANAPGLDFLNRYMNIAKENTPSFEGLYDWMNLLKSESENNEYTDEFNEIYDLLGRSKAMSEKSNELLSAWTNLAQIDYKNNPEDFDEAILEVKKLAQEYQNLFPENSEYIQKNILDLISKYTEELNNYNDIIDSVNAERKAFISSWQSNFLSTDDYSYLENSSALKVLATSSINNDLKDVSNLYKIEEFLLRRYVENVATWALNFWDSLASTPERQELFNKMFEDLGTNYSALDIIKEFNLENTDLSQALIQYYGNLIKNIKDGIISSMNSQHRYMDYDTSKYFTDIDTLNESQFIQSALKLTKYLDTQSLSNQANEYWEAIQKVFSYIEETFSDNPQLLATIFSTLNLNGIITKEGLLKSILQLSNIEGLNFDPTILTELSNTIITNVPLSILNALTEYQANWQDSAKEMQKVLSEGLSKPELLDFIKKAEQQGYTLTEGDFEFNGKGYILEKVKWDEYWATVNNNLNTLIEEWNTKINEILEALDSQEELNVDLLASFGIEIDENWIADKTSGTLNEPGLEKAKALLIKQLQDSQDALAQLVSLWLAKDVEILSTYVKEGDFSSISADLSNKFNLTDWLRLLDLAKGEEYSTTEASNKDILTAVEGILSSLNNFLTDIITKGIENVDINKYDYIKKNIDTSDINKSYASWVLEYKDALGKTTTEINELYLKALEKDRGALTPDAITDLQFFDAETFSATGDELKDLADRFNIDLTKYIENGAIEFNLTLGEYVVNWLSIDELKNLDEIDGFSEVVRDSINELFKNLADLIKNGISGSLNNVNAKKLLEQAASIGYNGKLDFTETASGLKLSEQSAMELYLTLNKVNHLLGQIVFKELSKSLQENNDNYKSISSILVHIQELNDKIADVKTSSARKELYEAELAVAKEILAVRSTSEDDSFNFMSNKIPGALNNPLNYWKNWITAMDTIKASLKSGSMGYEAFYNIVTEMGKIAELTKDGIKFGNLTLHNSQEAADLITQAAGALSNINGEIKIDFKALADIGIDFSSGAKDMSKGISEGIELVALSLIDMLDALISMLELIVTMEQLGDIDVEGNGIDFSNFFQVNDKNEPDWTKYNEIYDTWRKDMVSKYIDYMEKGEDSQYLDLGRALEGIKVGGISLIDILKIEDPKELAGKSADFKKAYASIIDSLVKAAKSGDYDLDNIALSVLDELTKAGVFDEPIVIDIGNTTLIFTANGSASIDWNSDSVKKLLDAGKTKEELTNILEKYVKGENLEPEEILYALALKKKIQIDDNGKPIVEYNGQPIDSNNENYGAAVGKLLLEDLGFDLSNKPIGGKEVTTTYEFKNGKIINVTADENGIKWHSDFTGQDYNTKLELLTAEYNKYYNDNIFEPDENGNEIPLSYEEWVYATYGVNAEIKPKFTFNEKETSFDQLPPDAKDKLEKIVRGGRDAAKKLLDDLNNSGKIIDNQNGTVTVDLGEGLKFDYTGDINDENALYNAISEMFNLDGDMITNIAAAITLAFSSEEVSAAISKAITDGIKGTMEEGVEGAEGTPTEIPLPSITLVPTTIAIDPSKGTATLPDGTTVPIGTVNAAVALLKMLQGTGYNLNNDDLTVEDIDVPSLSALVYALELVKLYGTLTEGDVVVEDLTKDDLQALITCLTLILGNGYYQNPGDVTADNLTDEKIQAWITVLTLLNKYGALDQGDVAAADLTDELISAFITLLTLALGEGYTQNPGSVIPTNLHIDSIYAFIQQLILQKAYSEQNEGDVKPEDLTKDLYARIKTLYLKWLSEQNIDPSQLGLDSDLYSLDTLTYHLKVDIKYELTDNLKFLLEYAQQLAINRHEKNLNKDTGITHQNLQVESPISGRSTRSFSDINVNSLQYNDLEKYINLLKEDIGLTGVLNPLNRENLKALSDTIGDTNNENLIALKETISEILAIDETNSENITGMLESVSNVSADNLILVAGAIERIAAAVSILATTPWSEIVNGLNSLNGGTPTVPPSTPQSDSGLPSADQTIPDASESLNQTAEQLGQVNLQSTILNPALNSLFQGMIDSTSGLNLFNGKVEETGSKSTQVSSSISTAISSILNLASAIRNIPVSTTHEVKLDISATVTEGAGSKGNVKLTSISPDSPFTSISFAKGNALARGQTLMGELGPELVVSGGRYFIVGLGGAEFVNLAPDAIVFNHKQTASLLNNGKAGRGKPITNERMAIAWAKGNIGFASADGTKVDDKKRKTNTDELKKNLLKLLNKNTLEEEIVVPIDNIILDGSNAEAYIKNLPKIAKPSDEEYTPTVQTKPALTPVNLPDTTTTGNIFLNLLNNFLAIAGLVNSTLGEALSNLLVDASTENATTALLTVATEAATLNETTATVKTDAETENAKRKMRLLKLIVNKTPLAKAVGINVDKKQIKTAKDNVQSQFSNKPFYGSVNYTANTSTAKTAIEELKSESNIAITAEDKTSEIVSGIEESIQKLVDKAFTIVVNIVQKTQSGEDKGKKTPPVDLTKPHSVKDAGATGTTKAKGTLMGELGPELVVSNGRYFVVGQNGPEFVNLADDAIVFNHLQTDLLFKHGMSNTRGKAVTNERNAVAFAEGNVNGGPAMASAADALAALKLLREMWKLLLGLSLQDLTSTGSGGGGGGGDKGRQEFLKDVERWYNLLLKIAELEEKINYEENRRKLLTVSGVKDGKAYYASLKLSLAALKENVEASALLARELEEYFNKRRKELDTEGAFRKFYTFDERGLIQFKNFDKGVTVNTKDSKGKDTGKKTFTSAFEFLNEINKKDAGGKAVYSTKELLAMFKAALKGDYDSIYKEIKASLQKDKKEGEEVTEQEILEALWSKMEGDKSEMLSLHDSIQDYQNAVIEAQEKQAQIIKEMKDNLLAVEKDVYDAIVDMRERAIEEMQDLRDAYEDSTDKFITGLTNALDKERQMYLTQLAESDLDKKRRRVAILQRTGGSGAEIASLQAEIESDELELYFEKQQQEIDAIQEAADKQIEKLDQQIELEEELLEYQKEHGLLWQDVSKIMRGTSDEIVSFITTNNSEWWAKSPLATAQDLEDALFKAEQWTQFRDDDGKYFEEILAAIQRVAEGKQPTEEDSTASEDLEYNKKEGSKSIEDKSKYKVTYKDQNGDEQTRYFRSKKLAEDFLKDNKKKYKDMKVKSLGTKAYWVFAHKLNWQTGDEPEVFGPYTKTYALLKEKELKNNPIYDDKFVKMSTDKSKKEAPKKPQGFSAGGLNTTTGLAMLHGTPEKPEAVFNAEQTEILRNKILSNKPTSLLSLLQSLQGAMATAANNTTNINRSAATEIGSIALNMNVSQIANDYDAKRAGEQAMTEMLRIARKTNVTAIRG